MAGTALTLGSSSALATCGSSDYLGSICPVAFNFCPRGTAEAAGQLLPITNYQSLYSLYGTTYGGDGRTTFALPDLRGRAPIGQGQAPGLANYRLGQREGAETHTLSIAQMPRHTHSASTFVNVSVDSALRADSASGDSDSPDGNLLASRKRTRVYSSALPDVQMSADAIDSTATAGATTTIVNTGGSQSFDLRAPYLAIKYCVVIDGPFPPRN
ncbi:MAG: phage tail protein [Gammaproteobacteria bacterium]|nr:phage tail protein [Gammaproteobacteria bacterium]